MKLQNFEVPTGANYTEFLRDYLKENELPASLHDADTAFDLDFLETFKNYFYMREIGFYTEEMFKQKLESQIDVMLPYYIDKATKMKLIFNQIFENGFSITQTNNLTRQNNGSSERSHTQTNNLAGSESTTTARDVSDTKVIDRSESETLDDTNVQTNNTQQDLTDTGDAKEIVYNTPIGSQNDNLPYDAISSGKTTHTSKTARQNDTGTITNAKDATKDIDIDETATTTIDEDITGTKATTDTGTITHAEEDENNETETNTGTITTLYSKNPRYNSIEALKAFQEDFRNIVRDCLRSFDCLFMQIY